VKENYATKVLGKIIRKSSNKKESIIYFSK